MRQGNGSKCAARHMTAAMFRPHYSESLRGGLLMTLIFLKTSQNSPSPTQNPSSSKTHLHCLLMLQLQRRVWSWHGRLLYSGLVWFSILGDYVRGGKGRCFTVQYVLHTIECHTIPVSKYLMVIEALYSIETILRQHTYHVCRILVCHASPCLSPAYSA